MEVGWLVWSPNPGRDVVTVAVKATFDLPPEGDATLADEQRFVTGDEHHDDDVERSIRWASDLEPLKPRGECWVVGSFHAAHGLPVARSAVAFSVGRVSKQLAVSGDRIWRAGRASEPTEVSALPLTWERSFGGRGFEANPVGRGIAGPELPNLEDPAALMQVADQRPRPAGFAPIPRGWRSRMRWAGTYDARWQAERYPGYAEDLDYRLFLAAPEDQQIDGFWAGDETIRLRHLHPMHPTIEARLPGLRAQAFVTKGGKLTDVGLRLDTIAVDADAGQVVGIWRGVTDLPADGLDAFEHLFVVHHGPEDRPPDYAAWYQRKLDADAAAAAGEDAEEPPAPGAPSVDAPTVDAPALGSPAVDAPELGVPGAPALGAPLMEAPAIPAAPEADAEVDAEAPAAADAPEPPPREQPFVDENAPGAKWAHLDQAMTVRGDDTALAASLAEELERRRVEERSAAFRPVFDDALGVGGRVSLHELSPEEALALEMELALGDLDDGEEPEDRRRVRDAVRDGVSCAGWDLHGVNLAGVSLLGGDFTGANLAGANFSGAFVRDCVFDAASLVECELSDAVFEQTSFVEADFSPSRAERVRFKGCRLDGASMGEMFLRSARFLGTTLLGTELSESDLGESIFEECKLDSADLGGSTLTEARFVGCALVDAWLDGVTAHRVMFDRCDCSLLRASDGASFEGASFKKLMLDGARFSGSKLRGADFSLASMQRCDLSGALLAQAKLMGANLRGANLDGAILVQASLLKCDLYQARFEGANLKHADLRGANLYQAELWKAELRDARLDLANTTGTRIA